MKKLRVFVKSFIAPSTISEFHTALGQFLNYRSALRAIEPIRILYLAVPLEIYEEFFRLRFIQEVTQEHRLNLLIYNVEHEAMPYGKPLRVYVQWIKSSSTAN